MRIDSAAEAIDTDEFRPTERPSSPSTTEGEFHQPPIPLDDWQLDEELRAAARLARTYPATRALEYQDAVSTQAMFDTTQLRVPPAHIHRRQDVQRPSVPRDAKAKSRRRSGLFTWSMLSLGLMTFVCGGVLLGWSFISGRSDLWNIGLPLTLAGQAILIVGLVLQLDGLWQSNRETTGTLDELDEQLHDLRHATTLLSSAHSTSARSFYAHMAEGASPTLLLADLKGQMDLLALRMAKERR